MKKKMYIWELHGMTAEEWNASHPAAPARPANPFSTDGRQATRRTTRTTTTTNAPAAPAADADPADQADRMTAFEQLMRDYENAHAAGEDTAAALNNLAQAVALSVIAKCIDPQKKAATEKATVSNGGHNPALMAVRRDIKADRAYLDNLTAAHNAAYTLKWTEDGMVTEVADHAAEETAAALQADSLGDGLDLVNAAVVAILEETAAHAAAPGWMEKAYTARRLSKRVLIKSEDSAKWEEVETTPISEVYRAVRREVQNSRAMQTDPRNGYSYIEEMAADPDGDETRLEIVYRRLHKWADLGGYTMTGHYDEHGNAARGGQYTTTAAALETYESIMGQLNLTARQASIVNLRMSGYGYQAIATYLGIRESNVRTTISRIREKCEKIGFTVEMWREMNAEK